MIEYPWHTALANQLKNHIAQNKLAHGIVINGNKGMGKTAFAQSLASDIFNDNLSHLIKTNEHPDLYHLQPDTDRETIKVQAIRTLIYSLQQTSQLGGAKVVIIDRADQLNIAAANALLKILEEPMTNVYFILISESLSHLLATIKSRCQLYTLAPNYQQETIEWLNHKLKISHAEKLLHLAQGAPLQAISYYEDKFLEKQQDFYQDCEKLTQNQFSLMTFCDKWADESVFCLNQLYRHILDSIKNKPLSPKDHQVFVYLDKISAQLKNIALHNCNQRLMLEEMMILFKGLS